MSANRLADVAEQQIDNGIVGLAIAVVVGEEVRWSGGFGRLDVDRPDPVTTSSIFPIQSVTKSIVATALMQWVERGAVGLDDPVNGHLHPVRVANEWEERNPITIRQLLTHTAGIPVGWGWGTAPTLEEMIARDVITDAEPGTQLIYANWGYDVLGYLIARLAGTTWEAAVADSVLGPLGMTATSVLAPDASALGHATGHAVSQFDGTNLRLAPASWPFSPGPPSGALASNVDDLARYLIAHVGGGAPILAPDTVADMHRLHVPVGHGGGGMGLGFRVDRRAGRPFFCHAGDGSGFTAFAGGHPEERVAVAVLMNTGGAQEARSVIVRAALDWALGDLVAAARSNGKPVRSGGYRSTYWGLRADVADDDGVPVVTVAPSAIAFAASVSRLTKVGERWRAEGGMFDGCELDFETSTEKGGFAGGLYPFEFEVDDERVVTLPLVVFATGDLSGSWTGTTDSPLGPIPFDLTIDPSNGTVSVAVLGTEATDHDAGTSDGWLGARFDMEIIGFGVITLFSRLGLVTDDRLEGLLYVRTATGEISLAAVLQRTSADGNP